MHHFVYSIIVKTHNLEIFEFWNSYLEISNKNMGIEKDFLMRQIMMLFEVIHKILRHRKKGEKGKACDQIQYFYNCLKKPKQKNQ